MIGRKCGVGYEGSGTDNEVGFCSVRGGGHLYHFSQITENRYFRRDHEGKYRNRGISYKIIITV
jgi:hypothetical protein